MTGIPISKGSYFGMLFSKPALIRHFSRSNEITIEAEMVEAGRIYNSEGEQIAQLTKSNDDNMQIAEVVIHTNTKKPAMEQPKPPVSGLVFLVSDWLLTAVSIGTYRRGLRRISRI